MSIKPVVFKYKTSDVRLNQVLEAYRDKMNLMIAEIPWLTATVEYIRLEDTNDSHYLEVFWGEDETVDNRTLEINVNAENRVINLAGNLSLSGTNQVASWEVTTAIDTPEIANTGGDLKIEPDVQGDVVVFGGTDIADDADGKGFIVHRKAAEFDKDMKMYIDQYGTPRIDWTQTGGTDLHNLCFGSGAGASLTSGLYAIAIGDDAVASITTVDNSIGIGFEACKLLTGSENIAIGKQAARGSGVATGARNFCVGFEAGLNISSGNSNLYLGISAGKNNTTASDNIGIGGETLNRLTTGSGRNVAIGYQALGGVAASTQSYNVGIGYAAGRNKTTGSFNVNIGFVAGRFQQTGAGNVFIGSQAGWGNNSNYNASYNIGIGYQVLNLIETNASGNIGIGYKALTVLTTGTNNVTLGYEVGSSLTTGSTNVFIGYNAAKTQETTGSNKLYVANSDTATPLIYGEFDNAILKIHGSLCLPSNNELRFYDNGNYVGFEAPALSADQIWVLPAADGAASDVLATDGSGGFQWITGTSLGNTVAAVNFGTDNVILRSDGTGKGVQHTGIVIADTTDNVSGMGTLSCGDISLSGNATIQANVGANDNLVLKGKGTGATYINFDDGTGGVIIGDGAGNTKVNVTSAGILFINDTANAKMTQGLTVNQGANDDEILALKSSDVAHGVTDEAETDTYGTIKKVIALTGGLRIRGYSEAVYGTYIDGICTTNDTNKDATALAPIILQAGIANGVAIAGMGANANLVAMRNYGATRWILDEDGDTWQYGNITLAPAASSITGGTALNLEAGASGIQSLTIQGDTVAYAANQFIDTAGAAGLHRTTSSKKYKEKIKDLELDSSLIYNLRPVSFTSKTGGCGDGERFVGLIAEEVEQYYPEIVLYNKNNEVEHYDNQMLITLMLAEIQNLRQELDLLKSQKP